MNDTQEQKKRFEALKQIRDDVLALKDSPLYAFRVQEKNVPVIGEGSHFAKILFVGEAPGKNEAMTGRPFCGASGKILDKMLATISLPREEVYIANLVKDRPPENRDPSPEEIVLYAPFLNRQIDIIQPKVIATLGRYSMAYIMKKFGCESQLRSISQIHGKIFDAQASYGPVKIVPMYHPAATIYNRELLADFEKDFKILKDLL